MPLAAISGKDLKLSNIRVNRQDKGLKRQHIAGVMLAAKFCKASVSAIKVGSTSMEFKPSNMKGGAFKADVGTAGSTALLLQISLPLALSCNGKTELEFVGGTHATMAPTVDYMENVFQPMLKKLTGINFQLTVTKRGYYPSGGGNVKVIVDGLLGVWQGFKLTDRGVVTKICGKAFVTAALESNQNYLDSITAAAKDQLKAAFPNVPVEISTVLDEEGKTDKACGLLLWAETSTGCRLAGTAVGDGSIPAQQLAQTCVDELTKNTAHGGCLDEYMQDQILIYMALAKGQSEVLIGQLSLHSRTAIHYIQRFMSNVKFSFIPKGSREELPLKDALVEIKDYPIILKCNTK